ncbi:MAG: hypothetical protein M1834_005926 [Cirrosporium novae-zelandiae]|nr:MAG: hypothetical protein M1834_005926 [Cirrosporium novae-zelandiae]
MEVAASVIAIVQITTSVITTCRQYAKDAHHAIEDINRTIKALEELNVVLGNIKELALKAEKDKKNSRLPTLQKFTSPGGTLGDCEAEVQALGERLRWKGYPKPLRRWKVVKHSLKWPLKKDDVEQYVENIGRYRIMAVAIETDIASVALDIQDDLKSMKIDNHKRAVLAWLAPQELDPSTNFNAACDRHQDKTGDWFLVGETYREWQRDPCSFLWLNGKAGAGKTILRSVRSYATETSTSFFNSRPEYLSPQQSYRISMTIMTRQSEKQSFQQLCYKYGDVPDSLTRLYSQCNSGTMKPSNSDLTAELLNIASLLRCTYVVIDSLDECGEREKMLKIIADIREKNIESLHILATSRRETDIEESLDHITMSIVCLEEAVVDSDIRYFVHENILCDGKLKRWSRSTFRWVVCQMDEIKKCASKADLSKTLKSLPKTLDETYIRMLERVDEIHLDRVKTILQFLSYSQRPLFLDELAEVLTVVHEPPYIDPDRSLHEPEEILRICSGLVTSNSVMYRREWSTQVIYEHNSEDSSDVAVERKDIRLAHFSVQEFLETSRASEGTWFRIQELHAHSHIAESCLFYLIQVMEEVDTIQWLQSWLGAGKNTNKNTSNIEKLWSGVLASRPFLAYAARYWVDHSRIKDETTLPPGPEFIARFLDNSLDVTKWAEFLNVYSDSMHITSFYLDYYNIKNALSLCLNDLHCDHPDCLSPGLCEHQVSMVINNTANESSFLPSPVYFASILELWKTGKSLVHEGTDVNCNYGDKSPPLAVSASYGNLDMIRLLVENGAEVDHQTAKGLTALQFAASQGQNSAIELLLELGADINLSTEGLFSTALAAAASRGQNSTVSLLIKSGADINPAKIGYRGTALTAAASNGHNSTVNLLLELGADINLSTTAYCNTALASAASRGQNSTLKLLTEFGADVNLLGNFGSALQHALSGGVSWAFCITTSPPSGDFSELLGLNTIRILLENGADVNEHTKCPSVLYMANDIASYGLNIQQLVDLLHSYHAESILGTEDIPDWWKDNLCNLRDKYVKDLDTT